MKIGNLAAYVIAATLFMSPLAFAAPPPQNPGTVNTKFKSTSDGANGCSDTACFYANSYDDLNGVSQGYISVSTFGPDYNYISCSGPAYGGIVSVNQGNGKSSIKATLNPTDPSCYSSNWNTGPVTVDFSGTYTNGGYRSSGSGKSTYYYNGTTTKYNSQYDSFDETFTGSITGFTGPFTGSAYTSRSNNRQQVK